MPHLRKDPEKRLWVIAAPQRNRRPRPKTLIANKLDPSAPCPLCPGNEDKTPPEITAFRDRGTEPNSPGWSVRVVPNAYPALKVEEETIAGPEGLYDIMGGVGAHEIVIETPEHDTTLGERSLEQVTEILEALRERTADLKQDRRFEQVILFKNRGAMAGASLYHPHFQLMALPVVPKDIDDELSAAKSYFDYRGRCVYCDVINQETKQGERIVFRDTGAVSFCPYASRFAFECRVMPREHSSRFEDAGPDLLRSVAGALRETLRKLDIALERPDLNLVIHTLPFNSDMENQYHWHIEIMPWTEQAGGLEKGTGMFINPVLPEEAARHLRSL